MMTTPPQERTIEPKNILILDNVSDISPLHSANEDEEDKKCYITELKEKVFEEILQRIENREDISATAILDTARQKLKNISKEAAVIMIAFKPVFLLFLFEVYLESQVNI